MFAPSAKRFPSIFPLLILFISIVVVCSAALKGAAKSSKGGQSSRAGKSSRSGASKSAAQSKPANANKKPFVVVIAGGPSRDEGNMSEKLGKRITATLKQLGYRTATINPMDPKLFISLLQYRKETEHNLVAFNACQGEFGGSGMVQAMFEWLRIPHTHSGLAATMLASNKIRTKAVVEKAGVNVAPSVVFDTKNGDLAALCKNPVVTDGATILKPITEANSSGIHFFKKGQCPSAEFVKNWKYGNTFMMERYLPGREFSVAVLDNKALGILEFVTKADANKEDRENKMTSDNEDEFDPDILWNGEWVTFAHIKDKELEKELLRQVELAHKAVGCSGPTRSDFRVKRVCESYGKCRNEVYFLEINTQAGMSEKSPLPEIAQIHAGMKYADLIDHMVKNPRKFD